MANIIKKVTAGQKFIPSAHEWNAIADVVNAHQERQRMPHLASGSVVVNAVNIGSRALKPHELAYIAVNSTADWYAANPRRLEKPYAILPWDEEPNPGNNPWDRIPLVMLESLEPIPEGTTGNDLQTNGASTAKAIIMGEAIVAVDSDFAGSYVEFGNPEKYLEWTGGLNYFPVYPALRITSYLLGHEDNFYYYKTLLTGNPLERIKPNGPFDAIVVGTTLYVWNSLDELKYDEEPGTKVAGYVYFGNRRASIKNIKFENVSTGTQLYVHTTLAIVSNVRRLQSELLISQDDLTSTNTDDYRYVGRVVRLSGRTSISFSRVMPYDNVYIYGRWIL